MAPDAPAPIYDRHGNAVSEWHIVCAYDSVRDLLTVSWNIEGGPYHKPSSGRNEYTPQELEDAISDVQKAARICGARRLF